MEFIIYDDYAGMLIKDFLRKKEFSSGVIKKLKKLDDGILVNGIHQNVVYTLKKGDRLTIKLTDTCDDINSNLLPINLPVEILYEDDNITVVNKPGNMPTHPSINNFDNTLANALAFRYKGKSYVFRAINRLDKDTSGVVVTANNKFYSALLSKRLVNKEITKEYVAVVSGKLEGAGVIEAPIARVGKSIIKREIRLDGEYAETHYEVLAACNDASLVRVFPKTGRTHQIRVHFAYLGHPIIGDGLYFEKSEYISRQALHCLRMDIRGIGDFYAKLPQDMMELIRRYFGNEQIIP